MFKEDFKVKKNLYKCSYFIKGMSKFKVNYSQKNVMYS